MINRLTSNVWSMLMRPVVLPWTLQAAIGTLSLRGMLTGLAGIARHAFMLLSLGAIAGWAMVFFNPEIADSLKAMSPFTKPAEPVGVPPLVAPPLTQLMEAPSTQSAPAGERPLVIMPVSQEERRAAGSSIQQQRVTNWLSKRYRVASDAVDMLVSSAYVTAKDIKLDPLLILSVVAIESRFNPFAESPMGAQGLMQVMSKVHHEKFQPLGGMKAALNPVANMRVGSLILKEYVHRSGSLEGGLKLYVGATDWETEAGYGARVLAEYQRLKDVANGKHVPITAGAGTIAAKNTVPENTAPPAPVRRPEQLPSEAEAVSPANGLAGKNSGTMSL